MTADNVEQLMDIVRALQQGEEPDPKRESRHSRQKSRARSRDNRRFGQLGQRKKQLSPRMNLNRSWMMTVQKNFSVGKRL